jgi:hypothetical protein
MIPEDLTCDYHYRPVVCRECGEPRGTCSHEQNNLEVLCPDCTYRLGAPLPASQLTGTFICDACANEFVIEKP